MKYIRVASGYVRYRVEAEIEYLRQYNSTFRYLERTYRWWRYNFPEYVNPSCLPDPPGTPPSQPPWLLAPFAMMAQRIPVWEMQLDNYLLFGHAMPTNAEVEYRKSYLEWSDDMKRGVYRPLPVASIISDTRTVVVPAYAYPFVHEELWAFVAAHVRAATSRMLRTAAVPPSDAYAPMPPWPRHCRNFVLVKDQNGRWDVVRPAQLLLPAASGAGVDAAGGGGDPSQQASAAAPGAPSPVSARTSGHAELRSAVVDMQAAARDAWHLLGSSPTAFSMLAPKILDFLRDRLDTLRAAVSEFMQGYSQGTREVESGKVDVAQDAQQFYERMLHTLPDALSSGDSGHTPAAAAPPQTAGARPAAGTGPLTDTVPRARSAARPPLDGRIVVEEASSPDHSSAPEPSARSAGKQADAAGAEGSGAQKQHEESPKNMVGVGGDLAAADKEGGCKSGGG